ncbi:BamA/TamA family outer membrane protein [Chryseobacterium sp. A301]
MRRYFTLTLFPSVFCALFAQNEIQNRVLLIGDAGELNYKQQTVIPKAAELILKDKTTVFFLGDNIYPRGMGLEGTEDKKRGEDILRSQFGPMRAKGAPVYFVPGNHDWDKMGKQGLAKIKAQGEFLASQNDPNLKLVPSKGCPDPIEIPISDQVVVIAYDSEWWLFPFSKENPGADCLCTTKEEVVDQLESLLYKNKDKTILLTSHHPFLSNGVHGGNFELKDHVFPLTAISKNLYIPLPVVGSLYPLLRQSAFLNAEDLAHPDYKNLIESVSGVFQGFSNVIYAAGHEHGLQLIKDPKLNYQIVSGSGSKSTFIKKNPNSLFASKMQGFVSVDFMDDRSSVITYYTYHEGTVEKAFSYSVPFVEEKPYEMGTADLTFQKDSVTVSANVEFEKVGKFHRKLFGENYRKEWAASTELPVIRVSEVAGGLTPLKRGGGMQTISLRLEDPTGKQWVLRSVNKNSESLIPSTLHDTFAEDLLDDAVSAQHPYSALMMPPLASALGVPSTNPVIGIVAEDPALGVHNLDFAGTLALLEEREPLGKSDNTPKMLEKIYNDNDDTFGAKTFVRSRMLDLLVGDWDRHGDQYRWFDQLPGKDKDYEVVPRDRDQVLRLMDGFFPRLASRSWFAMPANRGFAPEIRAVNFAMLKSDFLNAHPKMQFSEAEWNELSRVFVEKISDSVLEQSVRLLPKSSYDIRGKSLLEDLKKRRDQMPQNMETYYRFINSIVDIRLTNKDENVVVEEKSGGLQVTINKINKEGENKKELMSKWYDPSLTKEIRLYLEAGADRIQLEPRDSKIKLRVISGTDKKSFVVTDSKRSIDLYEYQSEATYADPNSKLTHHKGKDSTMVGFVPVNLRNSMMPLVTGGYNLDDGILLGGGFKYTHQRGFRKTPYTHTQQLLVKAALATGSFKVNYKGRWKELIGKADLRIDASAYVPNNTQNFFGLGNESVYDKENHDSRYYRARYNLIELSPSLSWEKPNSEFRIGPALEYYSLNKKENEDRFLYSGLVNTYDKNTLDQDKLFVGLIAQYVKDSRNSKILPSAGGYLNLKARGYTGLNDESRSFGQLTGEFSFYKAVGKNSIIFANRIGGGITLGSPTFYQALYLGGHDNLWGYRNYRFAGEHMLYNNLEARIKLLDIGSYLLPGQLGLIGFYDVGKVWAKGFNSSRIHQGVGGGLYYAPAQLVVVQVVGGYSREGWSPYITLGLRF